VIIPIGLDETRISRLPWVSIAILVLCVGAYFATSTAGNREEVQSKYREVLSYWRDHPYLELPPVMEQRFGVTREAIARSSRSRVPAAAPASAPEEQARLEALCEELVEAIDQLPVRRWSLVPARGAAQPGWLTHLFMHGSLGHLLGNMLVFALVVAPFLEDAWGRPFFLAFYLVGGMVAGAAQALPMGDSPIHVLGASGAISACLGAFALRFAHRRVRMFYWFFLFVRGTFFVPAWAYAFFGLAMDLLGLKLAGTGGGVAYAAHVGGFLFGLAVAMVVRATGLDDRLAPEGVGHWGRTLSASRAEDALAAGRTSDAREHLEAALEKDRSDEASMLALARIHTGAFDRERATLLIEKLVAARLARNDAPGARAILAELEAGLDPELLRPATAYRAATLVADPVLADRLDAVAARGGGALASKALLRSAERARASDPARAHALAEAARDADGAPPELRERAEALARACTPDVEPIPAPEASPEPEVDPRAPADAPAATAESPPDPREPGLEREGLDAPPPPLDPAAPVRLVHCRLLGASERGLDLATEDGKRAVLPPRAIAALAGAVVAAHPVGDRLLKNAVLLDLLLHPRPGDRTRTVLRLRGHEMALAAIHPGVAPPEAYAKVVEGLLGASGAIPVPSASTAAGRPFARFGDAAAFEAATWGRTLAAA
jgi:membrane associated rhomboid family serine protease